MRGQKKRTRRKKKKGRKGRHRQSDRKEKHRIINERSTLEMASSRGINYYLVYLP